MSKDGSPLLTPRVENHAGSADYRVPLTTSCAFWKLSITAR